MQVLLDTCALLWMVGDPARLSGRARTVLESTEIEAYVFAALAPEVAVGHADPCDRMIIATAQLHRLAVMTSDHLISACKDIEIIW